MRSELRVGDVVRIVGIDCCEGGIGIIVGINDKGFSYDVRRICNMCIDEAAFPPEDLEFICHAET